MTASRMPSRLPLSYLEKNGRPTLGKHFFFGRCNSSCPGKSPGPRYSTTWLARALPDDGVLITLESDVRHAQVARKNLERAGLGAVVDVRVGPANESLRYLIRLASKPFDLIFIDADKAGYVEYLDLSL